MQLHMLFPRQSFVRLFAVRIFGVRLFASIVALCACAPPIWAAPKPDADSKANAAAKPDETSKTNAAGLLHSLPLRFEQDAQGRWSARGAGYALGFEDSGVNLRVPDGLARLKFEGAKSAAKWEPSEKSPAPTNYFHGKTFRAADAFGRLRRRNLYPGIDVVYYGANGKLEYDFDLAPGADPSRIRMRFEDGGGKVSINESGALVLKMASGDIVQQLPEVYQTRPTGEIIGVSAAYRLNRDGSVGVRLGNYDRTQALVIDPSILYDFWLTGSDAQVGLALGHDAQGFEYMAGYTYSPDFAAGSSGFQPNFASDEECFLLKFNPFAKKGAPVIVYSTYFGGQLNDNLTSMVVDANGVMYFGGTTLSPDLPMSANAYAAALPNTNANLVGFVAAIDTNQAGAAGLIYSTYFGGADELTVNAVATFNGQIYATGWTNTPDMPTISSTTCVSPFQTVISGGYDSFMALFDPSVTTGADTLIYSSYLGASQEDVGRSIDVDSNGRAYITGFTFSPDFPVTGNAFQGTYNDGGGDAFVAVMDPVSGVLAYSTFLGGTGIDVATKVQVEPSGHIAVAGFTFSTDFPLTANAAQPFYGGNGDAFIAVLDPTAPNQAAALVYGTYYGGSNVEVAYDLRRDSNGFYYIAGYTFSHDLPVSANALFPASAGGGSDAFTAVIDPNNALVYASYITGPGNQVAYAVDYDASGNIYATGYATSNIFPNNTPPHSVPGNFDVFFLLVSPH